MTGNNAQRWRARYPTDRARVVKLVDTRDLKSLGAIRAGSTPAPGTKTSTVESNLPMTPQDGTIRSVVSVEFSWPGVCPARIDQEFVDPLEHHLMSLPGVSRITSIAHEGAARVEVGSEPTADPGVVLAGVEEAVARIKPHLPANARLRVELIDEDDCEPNCR